MSENTQTVPNADASTSTSTNPAAAASTSTTPAKTAKEKTPAQLLKEERIVEVKAALKSFPTLPCGYVTPRGVYFDQDAALASVDGDEEQVTKVLPAKK